ncbi:MAG: hypothetical protein LN567_00180 [Rickettsia endosymbiont of Graphium doson]|nr:hypothetical protein [Rickettsia endosymbiont of Graphium doson]
MKISFICDKAEGKRTFSGVRSSISINLTSEISFIALLGTFSKLFLGRVKSLSII